MQKKGILIVSFGTSHASTRHKTIGAVEETIRRAYPEAEILSAYTSGVIRRIWESRGEAVLSPEQALSQMAGQGISDVTVQPTHLICGVEFDLLREAVRAFQGRFESLRLGMPLLSSAADRQEAAAVICTRFEQRQGRLILLMGHGTPHEANSVYAAF